MEKALIQECVSGIPGETILTIQKAQSRRGDNRLLHRPVRVSLSGPEILGGVNAIAKSACSQPRQLARVPVGKRDHCAIGGKVLKSGERIHGKARLCLLTV